MAEMTPHPQHRTIPSLTTAFLSFATLTAVLPGPSCTVRAEESRFAHANSRAQYVHRIELYDAEGKRIDPKSENAAPYSPMKTCGKCHDAAAIAHGFHFNAFDPNSAAGRPGEPWIWTDARTGTQIPLSYRNWPGTYRPADLGISPWDFTLKFGHHLPGGGPGDPAATVAEAKDGQADAAAGEAKTDEKEAEKAAPNRWKLSGNLGVDCMMCHRKTASYNPEVWAEQIADQNFAWASTAAMGLAKIDGRVSALPDDFDPAAKTDKPSRHSLPKTAYDQSLFDAEGKAFFDVIRKPLDNSCYYCHSTRPVGEHAPAKWMRDQDVHLASGLTCVDCHRNGIDHDMVRGFDGENHPAGKAATTLSCKGCHLGEEDAALIAAGRLGAPKPLHKGLPLVHLEKLSCTTCHSGPVLDDASQPMQTAKAHELGLHAHREDSQPPVIMQPVLMVDDEKVLHPNRMTWPSFWGILAEDGTLKPLNPDAVFSSLRGPLRVRKDFTSEVAAVRVSSKDKKELLGEERSKVPEEEWTAEEKAKYDEFVQTQAKEIYQEKLVKALTGLAKDFPQGTPVFVTAGKAYRLSGEKDIEQFDHAAAEPVSWPLSHDVRSARQSLGVKGCTECHTPGSSIFYATVSSAGPAPDTGVEPVTRTMIEFQDRDTQLFDLWNQSFAGRPLFKIMGFTSAAIVTAVLLLYFFLGLNGILKAFRK